MTKMPNLAGDEALVVGIRGVKGYLIKDRKVTASIMDGLIGGGSVYVSWGEGYNKQTFPDFDYIAVRPASGHALLLIPNNL
jgi:hypothetical protein